MPVPKVGTTIATSRGESFAIVRLLGKGGMGTVVEAHYGPTARRVALKFLHDDLLTHPTIPRRFAREVELATQLSTAHVARTYGLETTLEGTPFVIMEMLEGGDLSALLRREGPLPGARACRLIAQACEALEEAHAHGIVHRDLKPENLFVGRAVDGSEWVKVIDFGISKVIAVDPTRSVGAKAQPPITRAGTTVGTPEYMAPEQLRGVDDLDGTADVYSLGVVLYELLSGRRPFNGNSHELLVERILSASVVPLGNVRSDLAPSLCAIVAQAMARDRAARIGSARALRQALLPFAEPQGRRAAEGTLLMEPPISAREPSAPEAPAKSLVVAQIPSPTMLIDASDDEPSPRVRWVVPVIAGVVILVAATVAYVVAG